MLLGAFGGGLTWGASVIEWSARRANENGKENNAWQPM